jgi:UDP-glucose 4-epimerase
VKDILVTGGSGYVGSHVAKILYEQGYNPVVFDLQANQRPWANPDWKAVTGNINNKQELEQLFQQHSFDAVIHLAASSEVEGSVKDPLHYYQNNVGGTATLLQVCWQFNIDKIVFSSTSSVYGEVDPSLLPTKESYVKNPGTSYGASKLTVEYMLRDVDRAYGIRSVSLRYFNASGASPDGVIGEYRERPTHLIPCIQQIIDGDREDFIINGIKYNTPDGSAVRDFTHVWDIAIAHVKALEYLEDGGITNAFNIGAGEGKSVIEIFEEFQEQMDVVIPLTVGGERSGDIPINYANIDKARDVLGWQPMLSNRKQIVSDAIRWYSSDLYKSLKQNEKRN